MCWAKAPKTNSMTGRSLPTHLLQTKWQKRRTYFQHQPSEFMTPWVSVSVWQTSQGLLRAHSPALCPSQTWSDQANLNQKPLRPFKKKFETFSGDLWIFFSCNKCPLGVLACVLLHSCSQPFPKVWEALAGNQTDNGASLGLGVCWCLAYWQEEERPEQLGDCGFSLFPTKCLNCQYHIINL